MMTMILGWTALHIATQDLQLELCELLLSHGAYVNAVTKSRRTPLMLLVQYLSHTYSHSPFTFLMNGFHLEDLMNNDVMLDIRMKARC